MSSALPPVAGPTPDPPSPSARSRGAVSHRQVLEALSGLLHGMIVAILSSTVGTTALPRIVSDPGGSQASWIRVREVPRGARGGIGLAREPAASQRA